MTNIDVASYRSPELAVIVRKHASGEYWEVVSEFNSSSARAAIVCNTLESAMETFHDLIAQKDSDVD